MTGSHSPHPARSPAPQRLAPLVIAAALLLPAASHAQETRTRAPCSPAVERTQGNVTTARNGGCTVGVLPAELEKIIDSALAQRAIPPDLLAGYNRILRELGVTDTALTAFFGILRENKVKPEDLDAKLREIAAGHLASLRQAGAAPDDDPQVVELRKQAVAAIAAGDYGRAETLLQEAFDADLAAVHGAEAAFNKRRLMAAKTKADLGELKLIQLQYADAADALREAADLVPPAEALVRAEYLNSLGMAAHDAAKFPLADRALSEALRIREGKLDPDHPDVAVSLNNLAELLRVTNRLSEAKPLFRRAAAILEKSHGSDDPSAKGVLEHLRELRDKMAASHDVAQPAPEQPKSPK